MLSRNLKPYDFLTKYGMEPTSTSRSKIISSKHRQLNIFMTWGTTGFSMYTAEIWIFRLCHVKPSFFFFLTGTQHNSVGLLHRFLLHQITIKRKTFKKGELVYLVPNSCLLFWSLLHRPSRQRPLSIQWFGARFDKVVRITSYMSVVQTKLPFFPVLFKRGKVKNLEINVICIWRMVSPLKGAIIFRK